MVVKSAKVVPRYENHRRVPVGRLHHGVDECHSRILADAWRLVGMLAVIEVGGYPAHRWEVAPAASLANWLLSTTLVAHCGPILMCLITSKVDQMYPGVP